MWYYVRNKQRMGPVSFVELQRLAADGQLRQSDMVLQVGANKWTPAASLQGLFPESPSSPPINQPPPHSPSQMQPTLLKRLVLSGQWLLRQFRHVCVDTSKQTIRLVRYFKEQRQGRSLRRTARDRQLVLGRWMQTGNLGDAQFRSQIASLDDEIRTAEIAKSSSRHLQSRRDDLLCSLAQQAITQVEAIEGLGAQQALTREATSALQDHEATLSEVRKDLRPRDATTWVRIGIGYSVATFLCLFVLVHAVRLIGRGIGWVGENVPGDVAQAYGQLTLDYFANRGKARSRAAPKPTPPGNSTSRSKQFAKGFVDINKSVAKDLLQSRAEEAAKRKPPREAPTPPRSVNPPASQPRPATPSDLIVGIWGVRLVDREGNELLKGRASFRGHDSTFVIVDEREVPDVVGTYSSTQDRLTLAYQDTGTKDTLQLIWSADSNSVECPLPKGKMLLSRLPVSAVIKILRVEQDVELAGKKGLGIHLSVLINHAPGLPCQILASVHFADGRPLQAGQTEYRLGDGTLATFTREIPRFDWTEFSDLVLFLPYELLPDGGSARGLKIRASVWCIRDRRHLVENPPEEGLDR